MVNVSPVARGSKTRMSFGKIKEVMSMPNLIEIQKDSYQWFLDVGLKEVFRDIADIPPKMNVVGVILALGLFLSSA